MERFSALIGFVLILAIAWALSNNKHAIKWKTVFWGLLLQIFIAIAVLKGEPISQAIIGTNPPITRTMASLIFIVVAIIVYQIAKRIPVGARRGIWIGFTIFSVALFVTFNLLAFLFENLKEVVNHFIAYTGDGSKFVFGVLGDTHNTSIGFVFATQVLPTIIFIASIFAILYYLGVMQLVVKFFAKVMTRFLGASGAESTSVAASIFMGQTEAPLTIRPFLPEMTMSELMTVMTAGMAHISGGIMAAYVLVAKVDVIHLLTAVIMTASGALVWLVNGSFEYVHKYISWFPASMDIVLGWIFRPIAWAMGVSWKDSLTVGNLLGTRMVLNEFVAFARLGTPGVGSSLDPRSFIIVTYALCGFANFSSIAIQIGGIGSLAPSRRGDLARLGLRAMFAGTLANFLTATIAGMLL